METKFRDRNAHRCDRFMKKDETTYEQMCAKIRPVVKGKQVLELAAGTGLISRHIADSASFIEVTGALPEMITKAEKGVPPRNLPFSVQDVFSSPMKPVPLTLSSLSTPCTSSPLRKKP